MRTKTAMEITTKEKKQLIKSQQGEVDAVILYRKLASNIKETKFKETFLKIAADEGKHAGILRQYTCENLKPRNFKAIFVTSMYKVCGLKFTLNVLQKGEFKAADDYRQLSDKFLKIQEILKDEELHGNLMKQML